MTNAFDNLGLGDSGAFEAGMVPPADAPNPPGGYGHVPAPVEHHAMPPVTRVQARRDVFWQNVCREILMSLAAAAAESSGRLGTGPAAAESSTSPVDELFDGRMGVITTLGQRIPIADVTVVFSCSLPDNDLDRSISSDVQCTIFRITTPTGETYTLPVSQIVGVHSVSESLLEQIEDQNEDEGDKAPFGFAAYTSLAKSERDQHAQKQPELPETEKQPPDGTGSGS